MSRGPALSIVACRIVIPLDALRRGAGFRLGVQQCLASDDAPSARRMLPAIAAASHHHDTPRGTAFTAAPAATDGGINSGRHWRRLRGGSIRTDGRIGVAGDGPGGRLAHPDPVANVLQSCAGTRGSVVNHVGVTIAAFRRGAVTGAGPLSDLSSR